MSMRNVKREKRKIEMTYIFNADDFGRTDSVNRAIVEGFKNGCLTRTTIMVNMPYFEEAIRLAEMYNFKNRVGLHINLTSGRPLTEEIRKCKGFCTEDGNFNGVIFKNKRLQFFLSPKEKKAVKKEIDAQIEKYLKCGFIQKHADSHGHIHTFPSVINLILRELEKFKFETVRISLNVPVKKIKKIYKIFLNWKLNEFNCRRGEKCNYFGAFREIRAFLSRKESGMTEIMLHPNIWEGDVQIGQGLHYQDIIEWKK